MHACMPNLAAVSYKKASLSEDFDSMVHVMHGKWSCVAFQVQNMQDINNASCDLPIPMRNSKMKITRQKKKNGKRRLTLSINMDEYIYMHVSCKSKKGFFFKVKIKDS